MQKVQAMSTHITFHSKNISDVLTLLRNYGKMTFTANEEIVDINRKSLNILSQVCDFSRNILSESME